MNEVMQQDNRRDGYAISQIDGLFIRISCLPSLRPLNQPFVRGRRLVSCAALAWSIACVYPEPASARQSGAPAPVAGAVAAPVEQGGDQAPTAQRSSPWLLVPLVSSNPKLGTSFGAMGAYLHVFDPGSRVSMFGVNFQCTSTNSIIAATFARTSFGADHHRIVAVAAFGYIENDYEDFLGSGQPLMTNDHLKALAGRYRYRLKGTGSSAPGALPRTIRCVANPRRTTSCWRRWASRGSSRPRSGPS
jgi:hypothetical protein